MSEANSVSMKFFAIASLNMSYFSTEGWELNNFELVPTIVLAINNARFIPLLDYPFLTV